MRHDRRNLCLFLLLSVVTGIALTACANNGENERPKPTEAFYADKLTLTLVEQAAGPKREAALRKQIARFEDENPDIHVELINIRDTDGEIRELLRQHKSIDVFSIRESELQSYKQEGLAADLSEETAAWDEAANLNSTAKRFMQTDDGAVYYVPNRFHQPLLFYRKDWFDAKALQVPKTWEELYFVGKQMTSVGDRSYGLAGTGGVEAVESLIAIVRDYNGDAVDAKRPLLLQNGATIFSTPEAWEAVKLYREIFISLSPTASKQWTAKDALHFFAEGNAAMLIYDTDAIEYVQEGLPKDGWATAPLPTGPDGISHYKLDVSGWAISSSSGHRAEAWKLVQFLSSDEANAAIAEETGVLSVYQAKRVELGLYTPYILMNNNPQRFREVSLYGDGSGMDRFWEAAAEAGWEYIVRRMGGMPFLQLLDREAASVAY